MNQVIKVTKIGKSMDSTDPNDYVFHSNYNTFKIILEGTKSITLLASTADQSFTEAHGFDSFIPLLSAFAKRDDADRVFLPNGADILSINSKVGWIGSGVTFNYIATDANNMIFNFDNTNGTTVDVSIRYFLLERV